MTQAVVLKSEWDQYISQVPEYLWQVNGVYWKCYQIARKLVEEELDRIFKEGC